MKKSQKEQLNQLLTTTKADRQVLTKFAQRISEGNLTRDENPETHFCVYFAAYDPQKGEAFLGHHKKSGLWLFNGGHIDLGETPQEALEREIGEEWGVKIDLGNVAPSLLTITEIIDNPAKRPCKRHYDIWHFIPVEKSGFFPEKEKLDTEFYDTEWLGFKAARSRVTDPNTIEALTSIERGLLF